jgi:hypothetical protein
VPAIFTTIPGIPESPDRYTEVHPDQVKKLPNSVEEIFINPKWVSDESQKSQPKRPRHELEHDAESVFWLLLYWAMAVQPEECAKENINLFSWASLLGNFRDREALYQENPKFTFHTFFTCCKQKKCQFWKVPPT